MRFGLVLNFRYQVSGDDWWQGSCSATRWNSVDDTSPAITEPWKFFAHPPHKSDAYRSVLRTVLFIFDGHEEFLFSIWMFCHCYYANILKPLLIIHLRLFNRLFWAAFVTKRRKNGHSALLCLSVRTTTQLLNVFSQKLILGSFVCTSLLLLKFGQQQTVTLRADMRPLLCPSGM
jgi:hypothetical protein